MRSIVLALETKILFSICVQKGAHATAGGERLLASPTHRVWRLHGKATGFASFLYDARRLPSGLLVLYFAACLLLFIYNNT